MARLRSGVLWQSHRTDASLARSGGRNKPPAAATDQNITLATPTVDSGRMGGYSHLVDIGGVKQWWRATTFAIRSSPSTMDSVLWGHWKTRSPFVTHLSRKMKS